LDSNTLGISGTLSQPLSLSPEGKSLSIVLGIACSHMVKQAITHFLRFADMSEDVPKLSNGRAYGMYTLKPEHWAKLDKIHRILAVRHAVTIPLLINNVHTQEPAAAHQSFSSESVPTLSRSIPILEFLLEKWGAMAKLAEFDDMRDAIEAGAENLRKWYWALDKNDAPFISLSAWL
jgi:hypothetical protein